MARGRAVAAAVIRRAQMRAALQHFARDADLGLAGVVALLLAPAARVLRNAARLGGVGMVARLVPVRRPLPDIPDHVVEAIAVRRERPDWRGALVAVGLQVLVREGPLPGIGHLPAAGDEFIAPGEFGAVAAAARGELPLRFGR